MSESGKRRAIVTGAASGIGKETARRLVREGVSVLAVDIDATRLEEARGFGCEVLAADLADPEARGRVVAAGDGIDFLVNAAGMIRIKSIFDITLADWRQVFAVNVESTFFLCQGIGPRMKAGGAIVNLSSSSAKLATTIEVAAYAATKATILSITRSFAYALASRPIRVNAICPGIVDTPMQERVLADVSGLRGMTAEALSSARTKTVPLGRAASAEECAGLIRFLLSDESAYMTGQAINYTGGMVTW